MKIFCYSQVTKGSKNHKYRPTVLKVRSLSAVSVYFDLVFKLQYETLPSCW